MGIQIRKKVDLVNHQASLKNINIEIANQEKKCILEVDPDLINVVIQNFLTNAIKFTPTEGSIKVSCSIEDKNALLFVRDNGLGMPEDNLKKLFNSETHFTSRGTENEKGIGPGMPICKGFIDIYKSEIWAESELGKGSTFYIKLPLSS